MRDKFVQVHMKVAETYAQLSSAKKLQVGCVIVKNDTIIGIGYNGTPSGWDNECEYVIPEQEIVDFDSRSVTYIPEQLKTKDEVIHAESNALMKVARSTNSTEGSVAFVTHAPCIHCSKLLYQAGVKAVYYRNAYRCLDGIKFLEKCGIGVHRV
jgi:dCMP deaminase